MMTQQRINKMTDMTFSDDLISLIKLAEGCRLTAYLDADSIWTIGYGHAYVHQGMVITQDQADQLLRNDLYKFQLGVNNLVQVDLTQGQFDALCDFAFNCGLGNLQSSTLLKDVNASNFDDAVIQFPRWDKSGGEVLPGLLKRRNAEAAMFSGGDWQSIMNGN